jgi:hypothetical protein
VALQQAQPVDHLDLDGRQRGVEVGDDAKPWGRGGVAEELRGQRLAGDEHLDRVRLGLGGEQGDDDRSDRLWRGGAIQSEPAVGEVDGHLLIVVLPDRHDPGPHRSLRARGCRRGRGGCGTADGGIGVFGSVQVWVAVQAWV